jgi:hypothetical protein
MATGDRERKKVKRAVPGDDVYHGELLSAKATNEV